MTNSETTAGDLINAGGMFSDFFFYGIVLLLGLLFLAMVVSIIFKAFGMEAPEFLVDQDDLFVDEKEL